MTDVEMKDAALPAGSEEKKQEDKKTEEPTDCFYEVKKCLVILEKAGKEKDFKTTAQLTK